MDADTQKISKLISDRETELIFNKLSLERWIKQWTNIKIKITIIQSWYIILIKYIIVFLKILYICNRVLLKMKFK